MREILFRGQSKADGRWVCGWYRKTRYRDTRYPGTTSIIVEYPVIYDLEQEISEAVYDRTVGQYVGIEDSTGNKIFEGDILKNVFGEYGIVECSDNFFYIRKALTNDYSSECFSNSKVIGNIHDNPELVKEKRLNWRK